MSKHTPAPWHFHLSENDGVNRTACIHAEYEIPGGKRHHAVCTVEDLYYRGEHQVDALANARLIAAAPEMLEALKSADQLLDWYFANSDEHGPDFDNICGDIYAAICKATGQEMEA